MSRYTTELRYICEVESGLSESVGYNDISNVLTNARTKIFSFDYPIFDSNYKETLETKILRHFYTREIGFETYGLWKLKLETKMNEIMPYYNQLYLSELIEYNPLYTKSIRKEGNKQIDEDYEKENSRATNETKTSAEQGSKNITNSESGWELYSDTPQGDITGIENLNNNMYLTNATKNTNNGSENETTTKTKNDSKTGSVTDNGTGIKSTDNTYWETISGYENKNPSKSLLEYRKTFLNIDMMIIEELEDLFFQMW